VRSRAIGVRRRGVVLKNKRLRRGSPRDRRAFTAMRAARRRARGARGGPLAGPRRKKSRKKARFALGAAADSGYIAAA